MSLNVYMYNRQVSKCLSLVERYDPDLVLFVETNQWWHLQIASLESKYPFKVAHPLDNTYGMILYSRMQLHNPEVRFLIERDVPSIHATVCTEDQYNFELYCLHPAPPSPTENDSAVERDAELLKVAKRVNPETPTIVMGDLNDVAWSPTTRLFQNVSGLLDPRKGRGFFNTFHVKYPFFRWPLDHVFHSVHFKLRSIEIGPDIGSDHFPIFVELCYHRQAAEQHEQPTAEEADLRLADDKIKQSYQQSKS